MSLIPYNSETQAIVLRRGNAVVVYDQASKSLQVLDDDETEHLLDLTECPYCHRPYRDEYDGASRGDSFDRSNSDGERGRSGHGWHSEPQGREFVDPDYFNMLAASQRVTPDGSRSTTPGAQRLVPAALRSGRSRDVSGAMGPPSQEAEFVGYASASTAPEGISSSAFSPGFFKQFFVEQGLLGKGGNGVVLLVEHIMDRVSLGQFACKRIPVGNNHSWLEKVLVEVKLLQKIPHKSLVQCHWVWLEDHQPNRFGPSIPCLWILQEYCNGGDLHSYVLGPKEEPTTTEKLKQRLRRRSKGDAEVPKDLRGPSRLTFDEIFSFFRDITSGLHHLHSKGYIHRDLKPSNCLLQRDGTKTRVLISDFGEVQAADAKRGSTGATGTISYCAPEVLRRETPDGTFGNFSTKSDVFSLGMIVYFMCFGRLPYSNADDINEETEDLDELRAEITQWPGFNDETRARPDLPEKLYRFLKRLLSVDPAERPSTGDILESIRGGGNLADLNGGGSSVEDTGSPRVSSLDSPIHRPSQHGRRRSGIVSISRPGLSAASRDPSDHISALARSRSPIKDRLRSASRPTPTASPDDDHDHTSPSHSRPMSPDPYHSALSLRTSRKIDLPAPSTPVTPKRQQSPRLMLPPPPARPTLHRLARMMHDPATISAFRATLFVLKILILTRPCAPYAPNAWLLYPLLGLAALDLGILHWDIRRSLVLLAVHVAAVVGARRFRVQCEASGGGAGAVVWEGEGSMF
ncbi:kinase-like protein [Teratosphaeria nubilosa]|uniref:Kinase-like protein n=1 Tax=Teratosphaeria nubilosa TaxID=161662 RepID=A0A6G1L400_9PEZI|nr:kinase-like protein [Teratosphaeria nubilosa]